MNDKKVFICAATGVAILICSIFFGTNAVNDPDGPMPVETSELTVAINPEIPGIFTADDALVGYPLQILESYAADAGVELSVVETGSASSAGAMLAEGGACMSAGISVPSRKPEGAVTLYSTGFAVLGNRKSAKGFPKTDDAVFEELGTSGKIIISQAFKQTKGYHALLDSAKGAEIFVSSQRPAGIYEQLAAGEYDYYVCEQSEARMGASLDRNLRCLYTFDEPLEVFVSVGDNALAADLGHWMAEYRSTNEYAAVTYLYFEQGAASQLTAAHHKSGHVISPYDHVMRAVGEREGADWRLVAAIAYNESRFRPEAVSKKGAKGLMQIMPVVSRQFGVPDDRVMDPEVNVTLAVKLLNRIEAMMKIPESVNYYDRMALVLASYNCGIGHVSDARRLAAKYGADPNSWKDVSEFLQKKSQPEYYQDGVVSNGRFRGSAQTLAFVNGVMGRYSSYCMLATL